MFHLHTTKIVPSSWQRSYGHEIARKRRLCDSWKIFPFFLIKIETRKKKCTRCCSWFGKACSAKMNGLTHKFGFYRMEDAQIWHKSYPEANSQRNHYIYLIWRGCTDIWPLPHTLNVYTARAVWKQNFLETLLGFGTASQGMLWIRRGMQRWRCGVRSQGRPTISNEARNIWRSNGVGGRTAVAERRWWWPDCNSGRRKAADDHSYESSDHHHHHHQKKKKKKNRAFSPM